MNFSYKEIKQAYLEVQKLLEDASGVKVNSLSTKMAEDLSLWGDDNHDFLEMFSEKYTIDFSNFNYSKHFETEGELFGSKQVLLTLLGLPISVLIFLIKIVNPKFNDTPFLKKKGTKKLDLTFGDLVVSKLKKEFCLRDNQ